MGDEIHDRYQHRSHRELYDQLQAGDPEQIRGLAAGWSSVESTANDLGTTLQSDLVALLHTWDSAAGAEFQHRLTAVVTYASSIARECGGVASGLTLMASSLAEAKSKAEDPAATDDHDKTIQSAAGGAAMGMAVLGPGGALIGGAIGTVYGHNQDEEEKERARQRMIALVTQVAGEYDVTTNQNWPVEVDAPPADLPAHVSSSESTPISSGGGSSAHTVNSLGPGGGPVTKQSAPSGHGTGPWTGLDATADPSTGTSGTGDSLAGASTTGTSLAGAATTGTSLAGASTSETNLAGGTSASGAGSGSGLGGGALVGGAAALGAGGLAASMRGATGGDSASAGSGSGAARPSAAPADAVVGKVDPDRSAAAASRGTGRNTTGDDEDDVDGRSTWLTEDDMDWGGAGSAAPAVLGGVVIEPEPLSPMERYEAERDDLDGDDAGRGGAPRPAAAGDSA